MSPENVEIVRASYARINRLLADGADPMPVIRDFYDPEVVMEMGAIEGTIRGHDGVKRFIEGQAAIMGMRVDPKEVIDAA